MTDYANASWIPNNNYFANRQGLKAAYIIVHGTAGGTSAEAIANYFASTQGSANPVSSHYIIGTDGAIVQCVAEGDGAWANGVLTLGHASFWDESINPNNITISIEHCKPSTDNSDALTPAQQAASFQLINDICNRTGIPKRPASASGGITGHFSLDPVNRSNCPGPYAWNALWNYLNSASPPSSGQEGNIMIDLSMPAVAQFMAPSANGNWRCIQTQFLIGGAILIYYKRVGNADLCGLTLLGLPLSGELYPKPGTAYQIFERGIVAYDPQHKLDSAPGNTGDCYMMHIDQGLGNGTLFNLALAPYTKQIATLQAQDTNLQAQLTAAQATIAQLKNNTSAAQLATLQQAVTQAQALLVAAMKG